MIRLLMILGMVTFSCGKQQHSSSRPEQPSSADATPQESLNQETLHQTKWFGIMKNMESEETREVTIAFDENRFNFALYPDAREIAVGTYRIQGRRFIFDIHVSDLTLFGLTADSREMRFHVDSGNLYLGDRNVILFLGTAADADSSSGTAESEAESASTMDHP